MHDGSSRPNANAADGLVAVIDTGTGGYVAAIYGQGYLPEVDWLVADETSSPLLLVNTATRVNALRVDVGMQR